MVTCGTDLTEAEDIKKRWQEYTELYKKDLHDQDNHDGVITHLEPDILAQVIAYKFVGSAGASPRAQWEGTASDFSRSRNFRFLCEIAPIGEIFGSNSGPLWLGSLRPVSLRDPSSDSLLCPIAFLGSLRTSCEDVAALHFSCLSYHSLLQVSVNSPAKPAASPLRGRTTWRYTGARTQARRLCSE